nr:kelch-like protein 28 [Leptinotarsa decemlineata]
MDPDTIEKRSSPVASIVFEASTQTPTNEIYDSPLFTTKGYCLKSSGHSNQALTNIHRMRQHGQLCDITLKIGLDKFRGHKVVLASVSPYFFAMFNGDMKEQCLPEIEIHDMDPTAIDLLIDYAYTGQITITVDNVQVLLPASSLLQMEEVREACCRFLLKQLHPTNCLGIRSFAAYKKCKKLLRNRMEKSKNECWKRLCEDVDEDIWGDVYKIITKSIVGFQSEPNLTFDDMEDVTNHLLPVDKKVQFICDRKGSFSNFTFEEIQRVSTKPKNNKVPGPDYIPQEILKSIASNKPAHAVAVYNKLISQGIFSAEWKKAKLLLSR